MDRSSWLQQARIRRSRRRSANLRKSVSKDERYNMRVHDLKTCSDDACWCHVISYLGRCHLIVHRCWVFLLTRPSSTLAPLPHLHVFTLSAVPSQHVKTDPHCVPQHGTTLRFVVKALGSVKHEGPTTSMRQIGVICQTLNTEAFTSFCQAYDGAMCSDLPRHRCLLPPHGVEDCTVVFSSSFLCAWLHSRPSRSLPSSWPGTAPFSLLSFAATGNSLPRWRLALAQEAASGTFLRSLFHCGIVSFLYFRSLVLHCTELTTLYFHEEFPFNGN